MMHAAAQLDFDLAPVAAALADPRTEELCINRPGEFWLRQGGRFERHAAPELDFDILEGVAILAGALRNQKARRRCRFRASRFIENIDQVPGKLQATVGANL